MEISMDDAASAIIASKFAKRDDDSGVPLAEAVAERIRKKVISGVLTPGSHLSEVALGDELQVSRNTLREVFRILTKEGILRHEANRGVFVTTPSMSTIMDIYRVRRFIECPALRNAHPRHPAVSRMRSAVEAGRQSRDNKDWLDVGSADIAFHRAIVELADSPRLSEFYSHVSLELRLVFGLLRDPEYLHGTYLDRNGTILEMLESGSAENAALELENYLHHAERFILTAYTRITNSRDEG
jgi:DNA-binding GntR family transcriptional regulator